MKIKGRKIKISVNYFLVLAIVVSGLVTIHILNANQTYAGNDLVQYRVEHGDTLWNIAEKVNPKSNPEEVIHSILITNHMSDATIHEGDTLLVPGGHK